MGKLWMLTAANLRKSKSQAVSLLIFVLIAAMFLNIGLVTYFGVGRFFDTKTDELNSSHVAFIQSDSVTTDEQLQYLNQYPGVVETEKQSIVAAMGNYVINGGKNTGIIMFADANDPDQKMNPPSLIGESLPMTGDAIYIPYFIMNDGGYKIGDDFTLYMSGTELHFTVAGATEEIMFGCMMNSYYRFYVSSDMLAELEQQFPDAHCTLLSARMSDSGQGPLLQTDYGKKFSSELQGAGFSTGKVFCDLSYYNVKSTRLMIPTIAAMLIAMFALILLVVSLIVIRFRINNSIEENMINIGALKAVGYRNRQIVLSIVFQFLSVALTGGVLGVVASQTALPLIAKVIGPQIALIWSPGFDGGMALISLLAVILTAALISYISARKIKKLHPLVALRGGITTHSFKKNPLPLDRTHGSLGLLLAVKRLLLNKKQAAMVAGIVAVVTFAATAGLALHYNVNVNRDKFLRFIAGEIPDAMFALNSSDDGTFEAQTRERPEVRKVLGMEIGSASLLINDKGFPSLVVEDCSQLEGGMLFDGRYPKHDNEIALGTMAQKVLGAKIGDWLTVKDGANEQTYLVTGIFQRFSNGGKEIMLTPDGMRAIQPDFAFTMFYVYLADGADADALVAQVKADEGDVLNQAITMGDLITAEIASVGGAFAAVAVGIVCVTVVVVILVLYMIIKTTILRGRRELGIQKALGFTTGQLMNQIALNLTPAIILGVAAGAAGAFFGFNSIFVALMSSVGAARTNLPSPLGWTLILCAALVVLAYGVSMLVAWRIRKISAYALISE